MTILGAPVAMATTVAIATLVVIATKVATQVPEPYMDEIFHIPQAQLYGKGIFDQWDPKLTTPPGLYLVSLLLHHVARIPMSIDALRGTNMFLAILLLLTLARLLRVMHPSVPRNHVYLYAMTLWAFPVSFFYYQIYYTDTGSTLFVLLAYLALKQGHYQLSGCAGAVAVLFRQTNVVWVVYFMVLSAVQLARVQDPVCAQVGTVAGACMTLASAAWALVRQAVRIVVPRLLAFVATMVAFAIFLVWNGSIVLGDKANHVAGLHLPQLLYFTSFLSLLAAPLTLSLTILDQLTRISVASFLSMLLAMAAMVYMVQFHTYEHPFLLSDNRHYSFYVWKNIYRRHWTVRYALIPLYTISGWWNVLCLSQHVTLLWMVGFVATLALTLVPSPLLEFRYFILPFLFYCVHLPSPSVRRLLLTIAFYTSLNTLTLHLFLYRPFRWPQNPDEWQRFMW
ncbi:alpha-2-glucosyltransferase Alg10 [Gongronella butleri]|nr:alpha-2-glucosyltransferase Alg10 [Gongronella butleri]